VENIEVGTFYTDPVSGLVYRVERIDLIKGGELVTLYP